MFFFHKFCSRWKGRPLFWNAVSDFSRPCSFFTFWKGLRVTTPFAIPRHSKSSRNWNPGRACASRFSGEIVRYARQFYGMCCREVSKSRNSIRQTLLRVLTERWLRTTEIQWRWIVRDWFRFCSPRCFLFFAFPAALLVMDPRTSPMYQTYVHTWPLINKEKQQFSFCSARETSLSLHLSHISSESDQNPSPLALLIHQHDKSIASHFRGFLPP